MITRLQAWMSRVRFLIARGRLSDEASDELRWHHELLTSRYIESGMSADDARLAATRQLGSVTRVREDIYRMNSVLWFDALGQDVRYAFRAFGRNRIFAAVVILTLALGIGANTAILSVAYSVLLKPLPYAAPHQIFSAEVIIPERREQFPSLVPTLRALQTWRSAETPFTAIGALTPWEATITGDGEPERLGGARISANFFALLGVPMARGREPLPEEEQIGKSRVVVISDGLWQRRYGADPSVIGRAIQINGESHQIVGIAPASLLVPTSTQLHAQIPFAPRVDIWRPIEPTEQMLNQESWDHGVLVRVTDEASRERGRQQLETLLNDLIKTRMPGLKMHAVVQLLPIREIYAGRFRLRLLLLLAASALLLLTACASIANVFLARAASRANEFATRIALGASRARVISLMLTETITLALLGGAVGVVLAGYGTHVLASLGPDEVRMLGDTGVQWPALVCAVALSLITGAICGIVPAWQAFRNDPIADLQQLGRGAVSGWRAGRTRRLLVGVQIALATVLLASSGLLLHSFVKVMTADRGYEIERVLAVDLSLFGQRYAAGSERVTFYRELLDGVRGLPGVVAAGAINNLPALSPTDGASRMIFHPTDSDFQGLMLARPVAMVRSVTAGYLAASGSELKAGRFLSDQEPALAALVSETLAHRLWPGEPLSAVVGRQIRQGNVSGPLITVAGVLADARPGSLDREPAPAIYRPYGQWASGPMTLLVRTAQEPSSLALAVKSEIRKLDPNLPVPAMRTMRAIVASTVAQRRFQMALTLSFAGVALLLGAVGVYGVVSYSVASRTRDIGLRIALGALRSDVMRWVFVGGMRPALIGLGVGLVGTALLAQALRGLLFGVTPTDPLSLGVVVVVLLIASSLACYFPARRAAALDPLVALRHE